jgi:fumarate reductase subunit C
MSRGAYLRFILRELSSIFVAWFVVQLLVLVHAVTRGEARYQEFLVWTAHPVVLLLNVVTFAFVVFHAITWFNLAPQAMVVRVRGRRVPPRWIAAAHFVALGLASALIIWLLVGA